MGPERARLALDGLMAVPALRYLMTRWPFHPLAPSLLQEVRHAQRTDGRRLGRHGLTDHHTAAAGLIAAIGRAGEHGLIYEVVVAVQARHELSMSQM